MNVLQPSRSAISLLISRTAVFIKSLSMAFFFFVVVVCNKMARFTKPLHNRVYITFLDVMFLYTRNINFLCMTCKSENPRVFPIEETTGFLKMGHCDVNRVRNLPQPPARKWCWHHCDTVVMV